MAAQLVKDLVCGMMIDPARAAGKSDYKGQTYYFCAPGCKVDFDKAPEKYLEPNVAPADTSMPKPALERSEGKRWWEFWK
jgi:YHS domain-containing protein